MCAGKAQCVESTRKRPLTQKTDTTVDTSRHTTTRSHSPALRLTFTCLVTQCRWFLRETECSAEHCVLFRNRWSRRLLRQELDDPVLLRSYRLASLAKLGLCKGGKRVHELERFFPTEAVEASTVGDVTAVLGTSTSTMTVLGTRPGLSDGKRRTRRKRVNAEYQSPCQLVLLSIQWLVNRQVVTLSQRLPFPWLLTSGRSLALSFAPSRLLKVRKLLRFPRIFTR